MTKEKLKARLQPLVTAIILVALILVGLAADRPGPYILGFAALAALIPLVRGPRANRIVGGAALPVAALFAFLQWQPLGSDPYFQRAAVAAAFEETAGWRKAVADHAAANGNWPQSAAALPPLPHSTRHAQAITLGNEGIVRVTLNAEGALKGLTLELAPSKDGANVSWACGGDVQQAFLPQACRGTAAGGASAQPGSR